MALFLRLRDSDVWSRAREHQHLRSNERRVASNERDVSFVVNEAEVQRTWGFEQQDVNKKFCSDGLTIGAAQSRGWVTGPLRESLPIHLPELCLMLSTVRM